MHIVPLANRAAEGGGGTSGVMRPVLGSPDGHGETRAGNSPQWHPPAPRWQELEHEAGDSPQRCPRRKWEHTRKAFSPWWQCNWIQHGETLRLGRGDTGWTPHIWHSLPQESGTKLARPSPRDTARVHTPTMGTAGPSWWSVASSDTEQTFPFTETNSDVLRL